MNAPAKINATRPCIKCGDEHPVDYYRVADKARGYRHYICKPCRNKDGRERRNRDVEHSRLQERRFAAKYRAQAPLYKRGNYARYRFGVSPEELCSHVEAAYAEQAGKCAACGDVGVLSGLTGEKTRDRLVIDHCHDTGKLRGLLCDFCNTALGKLKDDPAVVRGLLAYIERWK